MYKNGCHNSHLSCQIKGFTWIYICVTANKTVKSHTNLAPENNNNKTIF
jgi:hypothetical protein